MPTEEEKIIICSEEAAATSVKVAAAAHRLRSGGRERLIATLERFVHEVEVEMKSMQV